MRLLRQALRAPGGRGGALIRAALLWLATAGALWGASPGHGLIENRTGLPLVFPLQIKTTIGRDAYLVLRDAGTGEIAVTAYVEGGRFFRLLMPPGTYRLTAALGRDWEDKETLFGDETRFFDYPEPLTFEVQGLARKSGYLIDLRGLDEMTAVEARPIALCQYLGPVPPEDAPRRDAAAPGGARSVAPEIPFGYPLPPGPRDPGLDGRPELGLEFGNRVADVPLWLRLGEGDADAAAGLPGPGADRPAERPELRQRLCG